MAKNIATHRRESPYLGQPLIEARKAGVEGGERYIVHEKEWRDVKSGKKSGGLQEGPW